MDDLVTDRSVAITRTHIDEAKEKLILSRTTHLDSLAERLKESRVARVVQALLLGDEDLPTDTDDWTYAVDLGLVRKGPDGGVTANPLYTEVLARQLTLRRQDNLRRPWWPWSTAEGRLDFPALVAAFLQYWRENADLLHDRAEAYIEAVPHITFMAFLQRVVNGGGQVQREFAAGRGAVDLVADYAGERFVVELKRIRPRDSVEQVKARGVAQLSRYLDTLGLSEGWLLIFDQRPGRTWDDRLWSEDIEVAGKILRLRGA
jgi:hypothetical protein